jgi:hypothetical protein
LDLADKLIGSKPQQNSSEKPMPKWLEERRSRSGKKKG